MRRRALLAASQPNGGGTPEFPLYLNFDYCEDGWVGKTCYINDNEVAKTYYDYLKSLLLQYPNVNGAHSLPEEERISLGIEIYFDGELAIDFILYPNDGVIYFDFLSVSGFGNWLNGNITVDYYM